MRAILAMLEVDSLQKSPFLVLLLKVNSPELSVDLFIYGSPSGALDQQQTSVQLNCSTCP